MEAIVPDDSASLSRIGKRGQNVGVGPSARAKLDVRSDSEAEEEARTARASLNAIPRNRRYQRGVTLPVGLPLGH